MRVRRVPPPDATRSGPRCHPLGAARRRLPADRRSRRVRRSRRRCRGSHGHPHLRLQPGVLPARGPRRWGGRARRDVERPGPRRSSRRPRLWRRGDLRVASGVSREQASAPRPGCDRRILPNLGFVCACGASPQRWYTGDLGGPSLARRATRSRGTMLPSLGSLRSSREASHHPPGDWAAVRSAIALVTETTGGLPDGTSLWLLGSAFDVQDPEASALEHFRGSEVAIPEPT